MATIENEVVIAALDAAITGALKQLRIAGGWEYVLVLVKADAPDATRVNVITDIDDNARSMEALVYAAMQIACEPEGR